MATNSMFDNPRFAGESNQPGENPAIPDIQPVEDLSEAMNVATANAMTSAALDVRDEFIKADIFEQSKSTKPTANYDAERAELDILKQTFLNDGSLNNKDKAILGSQIAMAERNLLAKAQGVARSGIASETQLALSIKQQKARYPWLSQYFNQVYSSMTAGSNGKLSEIEKLTDPTYQIIKEEESQRANYQSETGLSAAQNPTSYQRWKMFKLKQNQEQVRLGFMDIPEFQRNITQAVDNVVDADLGILRDVWQESLKEDIPLPWGNVAASRFAPLRSNVMNFVQTKAAMSGISLQSEQYKTMEKQALDHFDMRVGRIKEFFDLRAATDKEWADGAKTYADLMSPDFAPLLEAAGMDAAALVGPATKVKANMELKIAAAEESGNDAQAAALREIDSVYLSKYLALAMQRGIDSSKSIMEIDRMDKFLKRAELLNPKVFAVMQKTVNDTVQSDPNASREHKENAFQNTFNAGWDMVQQQKGKSEAEIRRDTQDLVKEMVRHPEVFKSEANIGFLKEKITPTILASVRAATQPLSSGDGILVKTGDGSYVVVDSTGSPINRDNAEELNDWMQLLRTTPGMKKLEFEKFIDDRISLASNKTINAPDYTYTEVVNDLEFRDGGDSFRQRYADQFDEGAGFLGFNIAKRSMAQQDLNQRAALSALYNNTLGLVSFNTADGKTVTIEEFLSGLGRKQEANMARSNPKKGYVVDWGPDGNLKARPVQQEGENRPPFNEEDVTVDKVEDFEAASGLTKDDLKATVMIESSGDPTVENKFGYKGLLQLGDARASELGVDDPFNPKQSIEGYAKHAQQAAVKLQRDGIPVNGVNTYILWQQGLTGGSYILKNMDKDIKGFRYERNVKNNPPPDKQFRSISEPTVGDWVEGWRRVFEKRKSANLDIDQFFA